MTGTGDADLNVNGNLENTSLQRMLNSSSVQYRSFRFGYSTMVSGYYSKLFVVPTDKDIESANEDEFFVRDFLIPGFETDINYDVEAYKHCM